MPTGLFVSSAERNGERGFTLIEIMVALAVFSLAVLALLRLETSTARGATILDETLVANLVARNVANEAVSEAEAPAAGRATGIEVNAGRRWAWQRVVAPTGDRRIVRIEVSVLGPAGSVVGRASAVRPPTVPPPPAPQPSPTPAVGQPT